MNNLEKTAGSINKNLGKKIAFLGKDIDGKDIEIISTGIRSLDDAIGVGGLPKGRIIELHGLQSTGKTSLCFGIISNFQKNGLSCAFIDAEYSINMEYARALGVNTDELLIVQPDSGEEAFEAIERLVRDNAAQLIIVDSASALVPLAEIEAPTGKSTMGGQARLITAGLRKLLSPMAKSGTIIIFINQMRANIMGGQYDPYTITGGMALRFYASIMVEIKRGKGIVVGEELRGITMPIKIKKNKVGTPAKECEVELLFSEGFSESSDVFSIAVNKNVIEKKGNTYYYGPLKLGVGSSRCKEYINSNIELLEEIKLKI